MAASSSQGQKGRQTPEDLIIYSLDDLQERDFKRFKNKLSDFSYGDKRPIPKGKLENVDSITTKDHLINTYGEEGALDVTITVFTLINLQGPADKLRKKRTEIAKLETIVASNKATEFKEEYMESVKEDFQQFKEYNAHRGEAVSLEEKYTNLKLIKGPQIMEENMHEHLNAGKVHPQNLKKKSGEYFPTTIPNLFDPEKNGLIPKIVVLQGPAGIGKTMTSRKIMLDWASGKLYQDKFEFVFHLSCRELNLITEPINLVRLLSRTCKLQCSDDLVSILKDPGKQGKLLFIVDGFDELRWTQLEKKSEVCHDIFEETHKDVLLQRLLRKQILKRSSLIITTRPLALEKLYSFVDKSRHVEVLGFTKEDCGKYFHNFFKNADDADKALSIIKDNGVLYTMCAVPIVCWIVCTVLKPQIKQNLDLLQSKTATSVYLLYLKGLIKHHCREQPTNACLKKLCALAKEGILNRKILFEMEDLDRHGLSLSEVESVFLNENLFHLDIDTQTCYSFIHLSVQEFLAALYYVLDDGSGNEEGTTGLREGTSIPEICKGDSLSTMCKEHPHLALSVRFLFGLLNEKDVKTFSKSTGINISLPDRQAMEEWLMGKCLLNNLYMRNTRSIHCIDTISCLYETQNKETIRRTLSQYSHLVLIGASRGVFLTGEDCSKQLCYCLKSCESFQALSFRSLILDPKYLQMLSSLLHRCQQLSFHHVTSPREDKLFDDFPHILPYPDIPADLSWLTDTQSKISTLWFNHCHLNDSSCSHISSFLKRSKLLTSLDLSNSKLQESAVNILCEGLKDPGCTVQVLSLQQCDLTPSCCDYLRSLLITNRSLAILDLFMNDLRDYGIKLLCEGLGSPGCTIRDLSISSCSLTSRSCDYLRSVFLANQILTRLDLSTNFLGDCGIKLLCEGLRHPGCTLQMLSIEGCDLTFLSCDDLQAVLIANRSLTKLDLSANILGDSGIQFICEGLKHLDCTLQELSLQRCHLTHLSCNDLRSVLIANRSLTKLDLSMNVLEDSGIKCICEGLKHPDCTLQELRFYFCHTTLLCCDDLYSAISTNQTLRILEIRFDIDEEISESNPCFDDLRHLGCTVKKYRVRILKCTILSQKRPSESFHRACANLPFRSIVWCSVGNTWDPNHLSLCGYADKTFGLSMTMCCKNFYHILNELLDTLLLECLLNSLFLGWIIKMFIRPRPPPT
ncbi:NACHT, LRR and PYD domains-containing protein 3-like isoform X3 [Lithobates pipiens]